MQSALPRRGSSLGGLMLCAALAACTAGPPAGSGAGAAAGPGGGSDTASLPQSGPQSGPPREVDADPDRLKGLDRAGLAAILGEPSFQRIDGPAALLRYRDKGCMLDLFLYPPPKGDPASARVRHIEARGAEGAKMAVPDCFAALLRARQKEAG